MPFTAPSGPPVGVAVTTLCSNITVSWAPVTCLQRNSEITGYVVRYTELTDSEASSAATVDVPGSEASAMLGGLRASTQYSVQVAAVGAGGETGVFSDAVVAAATAGTAPAAAAGEWLLMGGACSTTHCTWHANKA